MTPDYHTYRIQQKDEPVETPGQGSTPKSVVVVFYDWSGRAIRQSRYGLITPEDVYGKMERNTAIDLSGCYIKGFSLDTYKREQGIAEDKVLDLPFFKANGAFFDHDEHTSFAYCRFTEGPVDFSGTCFAHGTISFHGAKFGDHPVDLSETRFGNGMVDFQFTEFGDGGVSFDKAVFKGGDVSFVNANFGDGSVQFRQVHFGDGKTDFHFARFGDGNISFDDSDFGDGPLDMRRMEVGAGRFYIRRGHFGDGNLALSESTFGKGRVSFRSSTFGRGHLKMDQVDFGEGEVVFDNCEFHYGSLSFRASVLETLNFRESRINDHVDLRLRKAHYIDFSKTLLSNILDLIPDTENPVEIGTLKILRMRNLGQILIEWERNGVADLIASQTDTDDHEKSDQLRVLKESFSGRGEYDSEDRAYVLLKRYEQKGMDAEAIARSPWNRIWVWPLSGFKWLVFDTIGAYATSPLRVLISLIVVYVIFGFCFAFLPHFIDGALVISQGPADKLTALEKGFYHSAAACLPISYGDYYPVGQFRWITGVESFIGVFLRAYFIVAFVRKILR